MAWFKRAPPIAPLRVPSETQFVTVFPRDSRDILLRNDRLILYLLDIDGFWHNRKRAESFQNYPVLGHVEIGDAKTKGALLASFLDGVARSSTRTLCFNPRHGLRAVRNGKSVDFVICFSCVQMQVFDGTTEIPPYVGISNAPKKFFNDLLTKNSVQLSSE